MIIRSKGSTAESVPDATCLECHKTEGEQITEGDTLIDLETDMPALRNNGSQVNRSN